MLENRHLKVACTLGWLVILASNFWTMRDWSERTGVYDDLCYLRQAHLFQRFGLGGIDTDITRDDDRYFATMLRDIGFPESNDPLRVPCHNPMEKTGKIVIQYPPGTGFLLAAFPSGFQRVPLYAAANLVVLLVAFSALCRAGTLRTIAASAAIGNLALYSMVNPAKASFSIAPTFMICALAGYLTVVMFAAVNPRVRLAATATTGLLLGLTVCFRLPNLFLSAGPLIWLSIEVLRKRNAESLLKAAVFGAACLAGFAPVLVANAINAGSPFATTYGPGDVVPLDLTFSIARDYLVDAQGAMIMVALAWAGWSLRSAGRRWIAAVVLTNLICNLLFFLSHPISTPYYLMPIAMLSLWTLLFNEVRDGAVPVEREELPRPA